MSRSVDCVFCFKSVGIPNEENSNANLISGTTVSFIKFVQQYLNCDVKYGNKEPVTSVFGGSTTENLHSCSDCNLLISRSLDLYNQLKLTEFKLNWSLYTLANVMSTAIEVPSRVFAFNDNVIRSTEDFGLRSEEINSFRQDLINKCYRRYYEQAPRVKLDSHDLNNVVEQNKKATTLQRSPITIAENMFPENYVDSDNSPASCNASEINFELQNSPVPLNCCSTDTPASIHDSDSDHDNYDRDDRVCQNEFATDVKPCFEKIKLTPDCDTDILEKTKEKVTRKKRHAKDAVDNSDQFKKVPPKISAPKTAVTDFATLFQRAMSTQPLMSEMQQGPNELETENASFGESDNETNEDESVEETEEDIIRHDVVSISKQCGNIPSKISPNIHTQKTSDIHFQNLFQHAMSTQDSHEMEQGHYEFEPENAFSGESDIEPCEGENADEKPNKRRKYANCLARNKMTDVLAAAFKPAPGTPPLPQRPQLEETKHTTEKQIINWYATNKFEYVRKTRNDVGRYLIPFPKSQTQTTDKVKGAPDPRIKTLSQHLTRAQQRLAAALLHTPKFSCEVESCEEKFVFKDHLQIHSKLHGGFPCGLCSHVELYAPKLGEHVLTQHCKTISSTKNVGTFVHCPMDTCEALEFDSRNYVIHFLQKHLNLDVSALGCVICNCSVVHSNHCHFRNFHDIFNTEPKDVYNCESCPAFFHTHTKLSMHLSTAHNKVPTQCAFCKKTMGRQVLRKHQSRCQAKTESFTHQCSYPNCNTKFKTEGRLRQHMRACTFNPEGVWYKCTSCKMGYRDEEQYKRHMECHKRGRESASIRMKICEICGKELSSQRYSLHMRYHAGPESWKHICPQCGKKCMTPQKLKDHMLSHEKAFVCELCGAKYGHAHSLKLHVRQKHGDIPVKEDSGDDKAETPTANIDISLKQLCLEVCQQFNIPKKELMG